MSIIFKKAGTNKINFRKGGKKINFYKTVNTETIPSQIIISNAGTAAFNDTYTIQNGTINNYSYWIGDTNGYYLAALRTGPPENFMWVVVDDTAPPIEAFNGYSFYLMGPIYNPILLNYPPEATSLNAFGVAQGSAVLTYLNNQLSIPSNSLAFWKLADLTDSIGANTLTNNGGVQFVTGKIGNCAQFDGTSQSLGINSFISPFNTASPYTVSLWYNINTLKNYFSLISCSNTGTFNVHGFENGDLAINNSQFADISVSNFFTINSWNHFVITRNSSSQIAVWKNGIKVHESTAVVQYGNVPFINIGNLDTNGTSFATDGKIDAVGLWQRELTEQEILNLYNNGNGLEP